MHIARLAGRAGKPLRGWKAEAAAIIAQMYVIIQPDIRNKNIGHRQAAEKYWN